MKDPFFLYFPYGPLHLDMYEQIAASLVKLGEKMK